MAGSTTRALFVSLALGFAVLSLVEGRDHLVGGKPGAWKIPSSDSNTLNKWSGISRFQVGDYLVWKYDAQKDSVLQVTRDAYLTCNTTHPISEDKDGDTKVLLDHSGPYYFISGEEGHCEKGQKMIVVVMAPRNRHIGASPSPSPSPAASAEEGPAVAPTSAAGGLKAGFMVVAMGFLVGVFGI